MPLAEVKEMIKQAPISSILGRYLTITKKGSSQVALCPFHSDKNPSLHVNDHKGLFMCFACQTGGDAITFVEKFKRIDFKDALVEIAQILGIPTDDVFRKPDPRYDLAYSVMEEATALYRQYALSNTASIYQDFLKERKIKLETAEKFRLGYAPAQNIFTQKILSHPEKSQRLAMAIELGLIRDYKGSQFDTFRNRIIFPIWNSSGTVVGFGSRATMEEQQGKYVNSQESFLFNKKNILYGFHLAKNPIRQKNAVLLVEGYMDLISLHQAGMENVVAVMGVALHEKSITLLKSQTPNLILALDSDSAGFKAMIRMNTSLMSHGILAKFLSFSPAKDPDEFIAQKGMKELLNRLQSAPVFVDFLIQKMIPTPLPETSDQKLRLLKRIFNLLATLGDSLIATERIILVAQKLGIQSEPTQIVEEFKKSLSPPSKATSNAQQVKKENLPSTAIKQQRLLKVEKTLLKECVLYPECVSHPLFPELLDFVKHDDVKKVLRWLQKFYYEIDEKDFSQTVTNFLGKESLSLEVKEIVGAALYNHKLHSISEETKDKIVKDLQRNLQWDALVEQRNGIRLQQSQCQDKEKAMQMMDEILQIERKLFQLKK